MPPIVSTVSALQRFYLFIMLLSWQDAFLTRFLQPCFLSGKQQSAQLSPIHQSYPNLNESEFTKRIDQYQNQPCHIHGTAGVFQPIPSQGLPPAADRSLHGWNPFGFAAIPLFTYPPHCFYSRREHRKRHSAPLPLHYVTVMARCFSYRLFTPEPPPSRIKYPAKPHHSSCILSSYT